jgi:hypothetical protein
VVAAATLITGVVSAFAITGEPGKSVNSATSSTSTTVVETPVPGGFGAPPTTAGVPSSSGTLGNGTLGNGALGNGTATPTTSVPVPTSVPAAAGPVGDPGQPAAEKPGRYTYGYSASSASDAGSNQSGTLTETVANVSSAGGVTRQTLVDAGPQGASQNRIVEWRPAGYFEIQRDLSLGSQAVHCTWNPAVQQLAAPLSVGAHWTFAGSCSATFAGYPVTVKLTGHASVSAKKRVQVGKDAVDVWVVASDTSVTVSDTGFGAITLHSVATSLVSGRLGLLVEQDTTTTVTPTGGQGRTEATHEALESIHPS